MASRPVRIGIIGTGSIARDQHAPACVIAENAELHGILSRSNDRAHDVANEFSTDKKINEFTNINGFLADPLLDAVIIASPDSLHFEHAKACLEAGKHVLVEKPLMINQQDGIELIDLSNRQHCILGVGFHLRWHPAIKIVLDLLQDGSIGQLRHINMRWTFQRTSTQDWRADPQLSKWWSLSGVGAHCLDLLHLFSSELDFIRTSFHSTVVRQVLGSDNDETAILTATFNNGLTAQILSSVLFASHSEIAFFGESGHIFCRDILGRANPGEIKPNDTVVPYTFENPFVRQLEAFCSAIISDSEYPVSGEIALRVLADMDAAIND